METEDVAQSLTAPLTDTGTAKTDGFAHALDQQNAVIDSLQLEQKRSAALYGAGSPKAQRVQSLITMRQVSLAQTQTASNAASAQVPQPDPKGFILYGIVSTPDGNPAKDIYVSAADADGTVVLSATTDVCGAYSLDIGPDQSTYTAPDAKHEQENTPQAAERMVRLNTDAATKPASTNAPPPVLLHLLATDERRTFSLRSPVTHEVGLGQLAREDLTVPVSRPEDQC